MSSRRDSSSHLSSPSTDRSVPLMPTRAGRPETVETAAWMNVRRFIARTIALARRHFTRNPRSDAGVSANFVSCLPHALESTTAFYETAQNVRCERKVEIRETRVTAAKAGAFLILSASQERLAPSRTCRAFCSSTHQRVRKLRRFPISLKVAQCVVHRPLSKRSSSRATSLKSLSGSIPAPTLTQSRSSRTVRFW